MANWKRVIRLGKYRGRNNFVPARGFDYMRLGGSHDRAETLKTGKKVQEAALLVKGKIRGPTEALRACQDRWGLLSRVRDETGH